ncbi:Fe(3+) ABC transporter substrate-binding protein [Marinobacteraceae bacterium S3BR75-40.1]
MLKQAAALGLALTLLPLSLSAQADGEVNVYSYRQPFLVKPLFEAFTDQTGIDVNVVFAKTGIAERLKREGRNSPADVVMTVDVARLSDLAERDLTQSVHSETISNNIPPSFRHPDGKWIGLTSRARIIYASKERVKKGEIKTYEGLADPRWKGKACTRSAKHPYNVALIASMIAHHGIDGAEDWLRGVKANLARKPQGNDRAQVKAIKEGICDVALGNSYYYGKMLTNEDQKAWAESAFLVFPNQDGRGTHVNISGAALTKSTPNREEAIKLLEFLSSEKAQQIYAETNFEHPVNPDVTPTGLVAEWGDFKVDDLPLQKIADYREEAVKLVDRVGFDN